MAKMKDSLFDVLEQSIDDEGLDSITPSPEALAAAKDFAGPGTAWIHHGRPLSELELRRFAVGIDRSLESATA